LLGIVENAVAEVHSGGVGASTGVNSMHAWGQFEDSFLDILGNGGLVSMEHIDEDRPAIEFLGGLLRSGWVADIAGSEGIGVGHGGGVAGLNQFGLADALENLLVLSMSFPADGERRETFPKNVSVSARLEGAEDLVDYLGGQCRQAFREDRDWRINGALLDVTAEDGIVLSLGGLGEDLVDFWKVFIIRGTCHLVHVGGEVFAIVVCEALLGSVSFELKSLLGIAVEDSFKALDSSVESSIGELRSPDSHTSQDMIGAAGGAGVEGLTGGRKG
jgi:hypothetical protein